MPAVSRPPSPLASTVLDAHWETRFAADPVMKMMFARRYAGFVAWFKAKPGS